MTATVDRPPVHEDVEQRERGPRDVDRVRMLRIAVAALAILAIGLGLALWYTTTADDDSAGVPAGVDQVIDDYVEAMEASDHDGLRALVTPGFRRSFYQGDTDGSPWRDVWRIEAYEFWEEPKAPLVDWEIERVGEPIVRGDGPWYVSETQIWKNTAVGIQYEAISTVVVVDDGTGTFEIDDVYWAGQAAVMAGDSS